MVCSALRGGLWGLTCYCKHQIRQAGFRHTRRVGNKAAHGLDEYGQCINDFVTWMEETPHMIYSEVMSDVNQLWELEMKWFHWFLIKKKIKLKKNNGQRPTLINEWITVTVLNELDAQKTTKLKALTMEVQN